MNANAGLRPINLHWKFEAGYSGIITYGFPRRPIAPYVATQEGLFLTPCRFPRRFIALQVYLTSHFSYAGRERRLKAMSPLLFYYFHAGFHTATCKNLHLLIHEILAVLDSVILGFLLKKEMEPAEWSDWSKEPKIRVSEIAPQICMIFMSDRS